MSVDFYKETEFKEVDLNGKVVEIPKDWEVVKLIDYVNVLKGFAFSSKFFNENGKGIPIIRIRDLGKNKTEAYYSGPYDPLYIVESGDLLVSMDGEFNIYIWKGPRGLLNQRVCKIWTKDAMKLDNMYLYYSLKKPLKFIEAQTSQTTVKHLLDRDIERIKIPLPPLPEQQKIAEILSTIDKAIELTDKIIAKTERLKKGLMQELLSGRIRVKVENGRISFYKETQFENAEIGKVPEDWKVVRLGNYADVIMGQSPPSSTYNTEQNGLPFLQGCAEFGEIYPKPKIYCSNPIKIAEPNDILLSVRAPVGEVNIAPFKCCIGRGLSAIRTKENKLHYMFLFYYLKFNGKVFEKIATGSTFKAIKKNDIENLQILRPPLEEQKKIAQILSTVDKKLEIERKEKEKLERIKKGLMDILLTGKVRVRV